MHTIPPLLNATHFRPGQRIAVAVSGGSDSVALLRRLLEERINLGILLAVAHVNHGMRGEASDGDASFVEALAREYSLPFHCFRVDVPRAAAERGESLEEAARNLRYGYFHRLMGEGAVSAVATGHTLDDQAETVLHKFLRGAWTSGLSGIHPLVAGDAGNIVRPFLENTHLELQDWLRSLGQAWREDESNQDLGFTRNRIRHRLLPALAEFNPQISRQLARVASIAADEEAYWDGQLARLLPALLLPGRAARGGGRASSSNPERETVAVELARLAALPPAMARRVLRAAASRLGAKLSFDHTEELLKLVRQPGQARRKALKLAGGLQAERSLRELRLTLTRPGEEAYEPAQRSSQQYRFAIPGEVQAPCFGLRLRGELQGEAAGRGCSGLLRAWKAGDRVTLRHSRGPKKVAEVLDRLRIQGPDRAGWPVVEIEGNDGGTDGGKIVWMRGVEVDAPEFRFQEGPFSG